MGWWGYDLLAGDPPMDTLGVLGDAIGVNDLYPLDFDDEKASEVRIQLERFGDQLFENQYLASAESLPVVSAVFLASGAVMRDRLKDAAIKAAENDYYGGPDWRDGGIGRAKTMSDLIEMIKAHEPGKRVDIVHKGLFETMNDSM